MKCLLSLFVMLVAVSAAQAQEQNRREAAESANSFRELLRTGHWVAVSNSGTGFEFRLFPNRPNVEQTVESNVEVRYAGLQTQIARSELETALAANRQSPNSVPTNDVERLRLAVQRAELQSELAANQARPEVYRVARLGEDYVALETEQLERFVPLTLVRGITRQKEAAASPQKPQSKQAAGKE